MGWKSLGSITGLLYVVHLGNTSLIIVGVVLVALKAIGCYEHIKVTEISNEKKDK